MREYELSIINTMIAEGWNDKDTGTFGDEFRSRVLRDAASGNLFAQAIERQINHDGWRRRATRLIGIARSFFISIDGKVVGRPASAAVRVRNPDGTATGKYQKRLFSVISWDDLEASLLNDLEQQRRLVPNIKAKSRLLKYHKQVPGVSVWDACVALSIDPDSIVIEVAA